MYIYISSVLTSVAELNNPQLKVPPSIQPAFQRALSLILNQSVLDKMQTDAQTQ